MTIFTAHSSIRTPLLSFLNMADLLTFSSINKIYHDEAQPSICLLKKEKAYDIFHALYRPEHEAFVLKHFYFESAITFVPAVFHLIPELFAIFQERNVRKLQLSLLRNDYGGKEESIDAYYTGDKHVLLATIVNELRKNTTLINCNLGLFTCYANRSQLEKVLMVHPMLEVISLHSGGYCNPCINLPPILYKIPKGLVWAYSYPYE